LHRRNVGKKRREKIDETEDGQNAKRSNDKMESLERNCLWTVVFLLKQRKLKKKSKKDVFLRKRSLKENKKSKNETMDRRSKKVAQVESSSFSWMDFCSRIK
jgi:hypothetical protein